MMTKTGKQKLTVLMYFCNQLFLSLQKHKTDTLDDCGLKT